LALHSNPSSKDNRSRGINLLKIKVLDLVLVHLVEVDLPLVRLEVDLEGRQGEDSD
jgi:hypothetical protein